MASMLQFELRRALLSRSFGSALAVSLLLSVISSIDAILFFSSSAFQSMWTERWYIETAAGAFGLWLGQLMLDRTGAKALFFLLASLLACMPYAWSLGSDDRGGYAAQVCSRSSRRAYVSAKAVAVFLCGALVVAVPMVVNFVAVACFAPALTPDPGEFFYFGITADSPWYQLFYNWPFAYLLVDIAADAFLCGSWAVLVLGASPFVKSRIALIVGSFVVTLYVRVFNNSVFFYLFGNDVSGFFFNIPDSLPSTEVTYSRDAWSIMGQGALFLIVAAFLLRRYARGDVSCASSGV